MAYSVTNYHRSVVVDYYMNLLIRFGPTLLLRHMPKLKSLVWAKEGLGLIVSHKKKSANREWSA